MNLVRGKYLVQFCLFRLQSRGRCVHIGGSEHALECGVLHRLEDGADVGRESIHRWRSISLWQQPVKGGGCRILGGGSRPACHTVVFYCAPTFSALTRLQKKNKVYSVTNCNIQGCV